MARLVQIFSLAGLNVRLGTLDETITEPTELQLADGSTLTVEPLVRTKRRLGLKRISTLYHFAEQRPVGRDS